jgi:hypothetical protein
VWYTQVAGQPIHGTIQARSADVFAEWVVALILIAVAIAASVALIVVLAARRRSAAPNDRAARLNAARRATRQLTRDARRRGRGTLRGKGMGGSDSLASTSDVASGSDGSPP